MLPVAQMSVYIIAMSLLIIAHLLLLRAIDSLGGSAARWNPRLRHTSHVQPAFLRFLAMISRFFTGLGCFY